MCIASPGGNVKSIVVNLSIGKPFAMVTSELPTNSDLVVSLLRMCMCAGCTVLPSICTAVVPTFRVPEVMLDIRLRKQSQGSQGQFVQQTGVAVMEHLCVR